MKLIAYIMGSIGFIMLGLLAVLTIRGRAIRQTELNAAVPDAAEQTVGMLIRDGEFVQSGESETLNREEFIDNFTQSIRARISSDAELEIQIMAADEEKGLLSVNVVENYNHPNGRRGSVSCNRTVILDKILEEEKIYRVRFYLNREDLEQGVRCYKQFEISESQQEYPRPADPVFMNQDPNIPDRLFSEWRTQDGAVADFTEHPSKDQSFYAVWNE